MLSVGAFCFAMVGLQLSAICISDIIVIIIMLALDHDKYVVFVIAIILKFLLSNNFFRLLY